MFAILVILTVMLALSALIHLAAHANVRRIKRNPDLYPLAVLSQEPAGEEVYISRADGTRLRTLVHAGKGPTVLLAHGYGVTLLEWNVIWSRLSAAGYRLIAFDHRGHGRSTIGQDGVHAPVMAEDIKAVLEYFDVTDSILVGHSMGGFLSLIFLLTHPTVAAARLQHCVIVGSFAGDVYRGAPQTRLQIPLIESGVMQKMVETETYGWWFGGSLSGDCPAPSAVEMLRRLFAHTAHRRLLPVLRAFAADNYYNRLGEITVPCTIVYGRSDKTTPALHSEMLHQGIHGSRIVRVEHAGHLINWEAPDQIVAAIQAAAHPSTMHQATPPQTAEMVMA